MTRATKIAWGLGAVIVLLYAFGGYRYYADTTNLSNELETTATALTEASSTLATAQAENEQLSEALAAERERNDAFANQIDDISGTVGRLDKLSRTDPELLQKYSKVYFLNENYIPSNLTAIPKEFRFDTAKEEQVHAGAYPHLLKMLQDAKDDDVDLLVASSYRSFARQGELKASYVVRYGTGANSFSAEQGYSEHQLGTAVDLTTKAVGGTFAGFDQSPAYDWLEENAYRYGFILSYPSGNTYYQYEPWHWRFVGVELARDLHRENKHFYDLDQREIDPYLVDIFD